MLGHYNASLKVTAHDEKKEMSNISKENNNMTPPNGSFTDDENERMKKEWEKIKNMDTSELDKQYSLHENLTISY